MDPGESIFWCAAAQAVIPTLYLSGFLPRMLRCVMRTTTARLKSAGATAAGPDRSYILHRVFLANTAQYGTTPLS